MGGGESSDELETRVLLQLKKFSGQGETNPNLDDFDYMEGANSHSLEGGNYKPKSNCLNIL